SRPHSAGTSPKEAGASQPSISVNCAPTAPWLAKRVDLWSPIVQSSFLGGTGGGCRPLPGAIVTEGVSRRVPGGSGGGPAGGREEAGAEGAAGTGGGAEIGWG